MRTNTTIDERAAEVLAGPRGMGRSRSEVSPPSLPSVSWMVGRHSPEEGERPDELANDEGCACSKSQHPSKDIDQDEGDPPRAPVLPPLCRKTLSDGVGFLLYCRNRSLYEVNYQVERAVIAIHGSGLDAQRYYDRTIESANLAGVNMNKTDIIAPQFLEDPYTSNGNDYYYWSTKGWRYGNADTQYGRSSFAIVDYIIDKLVQNRPQLRTVVIAGQSAGGQFVSRYAVGTKITGKYPHVKFRFWSANAGSYPWPTGDRPNPEDPDCPSPGYDNYPYGLDNRNVYMNKIDAFGINANQIYRHIYWTVQSGDTETDDTECRANRQGVHRVERHAEHALALWDYCNMLGWPQQDCINAWARHIKVNDEKCEDMYGEPPGHGSQCVWKMPIGQQIMFGEPLNAPPNGG